jgi:hypothetical protein
MNRGQRVGDHGKLTALMCGFKTVRTSFLTRAVTNLVSR